MLKKGDTLQLSKACFQFVSIKEVKKNITNTPDIWYLTVLNIRCHRYRYPELFLHNLKLRNNNLHIQKYITNIPCEEKWKEAILFVDSIRTRDSSQSQVESLPISDPDPLIFIFTLSTTSHLLSNWGLSTFSQSSNIHISHQSSTAGSSLEPSTYHLQDNSLGLKFLRSFEPHQREHLYWRPDITAPSLHMLISAAVEDDLENEPFLTVSTIDDTSTTRALKFPTLSPC